MKAILHIGMPKTGTTALQGTFAASREMLLKAGVLYPEAKNHQNHKYFAIGLMPNSHLPRHFPTGDDATLEKKLEGFMRNLKKQIAAIRPDCLLLSSETLFRAFAGKYQKKFKARLDALAAETCAVAYLRPRALHFVSALQQYLKGNHKIRTLRVPAYRSVISQYGIMLGRSNVHVNAFDRSAMVDQSIVADFTTKFLSQYGVDYSGFEIPAKMNETISAESIDICRTYREAFHRDENRITKLGNELVVVLREIDQIVGAPKPVLHPEVIELLDYSTTDILWLRDEHGLVFAEYDYRRVEDGRLTTLPAEALSLDRIYRIDRGVRAQVLHALKSSPWAAAEAGRLSWLESPQMQSADA